MATKTLIAVVSYHGKAGGGWQRQAHGDTIQDLVERALAPAHDGEKIVTYGASRTDVGVHARMQIVVADVRADVVPRKWVRILNDNLPETVKARWAAWAPDGFRPRNKVGAKTYCYRFSFAPTPDPLQSDRVWWVPGRSSPHAMDDIAAGWLGQHNFAAAHNRSRSQSETTIRTLIRSEVVHRGDQTEYWVASTGFLTHMVRILAGTLAAVALGQIDADIVANALQQGDRTKLGRTAPAGGLTLEHIVMPRLAWEAAWPTPTPQVGSKASSI